MRISWASNISLIVRLLHRADAFVIAPRLINISTIFGSVNPQLFTISDSVCALVTPKFQFCVIDIDKTAHIHSQSSCNSLCFLFSIRIHTNCYDAYSFHFHFPYLRNYFSIFQTTGPQPPFFGIPLRSFTSTHLKSPSQPLSCHHTVGVHRPSARLRLVHSAPSPIPM